MEDNFKRKNIAILRCPIPPEEALQVEVLLTLLNIVKKDNYRYLTPLVWTNKLHTIIQEVLKLCELLGYR